MFALLIRYYFQKISKISRISGFPMIPEWFSTHLLDVWIAHLLPFQKIGKTSRISAFLVIA